MKFSFFLFATMMFNSIARAQANDVAETYFSNVILVDQNRKEKQLYADLLKDKMVIISPFHSRCQGTGPVMDHTLKKIQDNLGDKLGKTVHIISLTVDHKIDNPDILKTYAESIQAGEGWFFITGEKKNIEFALEKFGLYVEDPDAHTSIFLVGNLKTKLWKKVNGLAPVNQIIEVIDSVINDKAE